MKLCRFTSAHTPWPTPGLLLDEHRVLDLSSVGLHSLAPILEAPDRLAFVDDLRRRPGRVLPLNAIRLLAPVEAQEVWAAGVTYLRSKTARMDESKHSASAYDRVYEADRPELFFKAMPGKVVGPHGTVGIRRDGKWNVPEPELALVLNSRGDIAGYTAGNDMSSRDIEGENLLYLPQAKVYQGSCALGPFIVVGATEAEARAWTISVRIRRQGADAFAGETSIGRIKRSFTELASWLFRSQVLPDGAMLLTGTGVVPPDAFTLQAGDEVTIGISGIGTLVNTVAMV